MGILNKLSNVNKHISPTIRFIIGQFTSVIWPGWELVGGLLIYFINLILFPLIGMIIGFIIGKITKIGKE